MNNFTKIVFVAFLSICNILVAQDVNNKDLNSKVHGIIFHGNQQYLVTNKGYIKVESKTKPKSVNDQWTEYYRKAHGDSTIQNPNTIIEQPSLNIPIQFFMPLGGSGWIDSEYEFGEDVFLYDFLQADGNGNFVFHPGVIGIIGNMQKLPKSK